jgi:hypothetical protein
MKSLQPFLPIAFALLLLLPGTRAIAKPSAHSFGLQLGGVATRPKELNTLVAQYQSALGLDATALGPAVRYGAWYDWRIDDSWSLGLSYSRMSASTTGSSANGALELHAVSNLLGARLHYDAWEWGEVRIGFLLTGGVGLFNTTTTLNVLGTAQGVEASSLGPLGSLGLTGAFTLAPGFSIEGEVGYQYARSGILKVKKDENTTFDVGDSYTSGSTSLRVDSSGLYMAFGLRFTPDFDPRPELPPGLPDPAAP